VRKILALILIFILGVSAWFYIFRYNRDLKLYQQLPEIKVPQIFPTPTPSTSGLPTAKTLSNDYHVFQTFNNCGPASLSMTLSYLGINKSQTELGQELRPYQVASGDNDDKSVTLDEMAGKAEELGFVAYHRPNGNMDLIKQFIANDIPVITRTWTKPNEDIGHFRVVKGYDNTRGVLIQDDSLQGKNLKFTYADFDVLWKKFNYEYLVIIPKAKQKTAGQIIGEDINLKTAWTKAAENFRKTLQDDPNDIDARFNLSVALYNIGDYSGSVREFEKVEAQLPFRTLWYQIEPIQAYFNLGNYQRVFEISDHILNNGNRAYSELYIIRGNIYLKQGNKEAARQEFEKAVIYNENLKAARDALNNL